MIRVFARGRLDHLAWRKQIIARGASEAIGPPFLRCGKILFIHSIPRQASRSVRHLTAPAEKLATRLITTDAWETNGRFQADNVERLNNFTVETPTLRVTQYWRRAYPVSEFSPTQPTVGMLPFHCV